jgi:Spy/CpxP family protein refolding chaperone
MPIGGKLDRDFVDKSITPGSLKARVHAIGATQAALRQTHLKYHLLTVEVLTPEQMDRYAELRGYKGRAHRGGHH